MILNISIFAAFFGIGILFYIVLGICDLLDRIQKVLDESDREEYFDNPANWNKGGNDAEN